MQRLSRWGAVAKKVKEIIADIKAAISMLGNSDAEIRALKDDAESLEKINAMFDSLLEKAGESYRAENENGQKNNTAGAVKKSLKGDTFEKITRNTSDEERARILRNKKIKNIAFTGVLPLEDTERFEKISSWDDIDKIKGNEKRSLILKIAEEFGVFKKHTNDDVKLSFEFSKNNYRESFGKQKKNFQSFAKMFSVFEQVIESAVGVEVHNRNNEGYKPDPTLKNVYVLFSAFGDGDSIIPVKLEVKEFSDKENTLYVAVTLETIKMTEVSKQGTTENGVAQNSRSVNISISDLLTKINPKDVKFLKYIPNELLTDEQIASKNKYENKDLSLNEKKYSRKKTDADYMAAVESGDTETAQRMVDEAAKLDGSGIFKTADGQNAVKTEDGKEHNIADITFGDENVQRLYDATEGMTAESANLFVSEYNGETVDEYKAAANYFYRLGSTGMTAESIRKSFNPDWVSYLSEEAQEKFANLGAAERPETAGITDLTTSKKSETEKMQFDIISEIGKESGLEFIVVDDWKGINGSFFRGTNRVVLSRKAEYGLLTRTAGHEAYHYVEQYAPETAAKLRNYVVDALREKGEDIDTLLEKYAKQTDGDNPVYETREKQEAELVADSMFDVFSNRETVYKLANENMSLTKEIKRVLDRTLSLIANKLNIAASIRNTEGKITNPEIKALIDEKDKLSHISKLMKEGLAQAKQNREAQGADQKNNTAEAVASTKNEFSYDELIKKPDMFVTTLDKNVPLINGRLDRKTLKTMALNSLSGLDNGKNNLGRNYVYVKDIDDYVSVNSKSIEHGLSRNATATAYATTALGNILNNSIMINKLVPRESNVVSAYILLGMAADDTGNMYPTRFIVNVYKDGNLDVVDMEFLNALYSAKAQKNEAWRTKYTLSNQHNANAHSGFNISISELLDIVKDNYPDILPEEVLKHYGLFERPKSEVSDDILYSRKNEETPIEAMFGFYSETIKENRGWQLLHSMLEIQTNSARKGIHFKGKDIENVARDIKNEYSCSLTLGEMKERLNVLYDYIANQGTLADEDMKRVNSVAAQVARGFLESSTSKDTVLWEQRFDVIDS